jgi:hypothetical protein
MLQLLVANQSRSPIRLAVVVSNVPTSVVTLSPSAMRTQATTESLCFKGATTWV